jgi:group II intron reverse transcriptase/maturase
MKEPLEGTMAGTPNPDTISTKQERIATLAREAPTMAFRTLAHHVDLDWMREAHRQTRKDGALGVDKVAPATYAEDLDGNLSRLLDQAKSGLYRAPPVRRVHIPKGNGETRPLGIPTFEDKILQRAVVMLLTPIYETDFRDCSFGFRPGRSPHQALDRIHEHLRSMGGAWILDVDLRKFFDTLDHVHLQALVRNRVADGVILRLIGKWLNAGALDNGAQVHPEAGTPQGGVISPLLANIYLHEVLDVWFEDIVTPRLSGQAFLVRYADDFVMGFTNEQDALRVYEVLPKRFEKFGLRVHPDKTRMVRFVEPHDDDEEPPGTFDFLGFTHYWGRSRANRPIVKRKTASGRLTRALGRVREWCKANRHKPVRLQHAALSRKMTGHYGYYGVTGNYRSLRAFFESIKRVWKYWLNERSQRARMTWQRFKNLLVTWPLPRPRVVHSVYNAKPTF